MKGERLTWEEMKQRYPDQWLVVVDFERAERGGIRSGVVAHHSADRSARSETFRLGVPPGRSHLLPLHGQIDL